MPRSVYDTVMRMANGAEPRSQSPDVSKPIGLPIRFLTNISRLLLVVAAATIVSLLLKRLSLNESNSIMVYLLGVVFVAYATEGYLYSIAASILSVLAFNFFFTVPYFTFHAYGRDYPMTFAVMFLVAMVTSSMTARIKVLRRQSEARELRLHFLNRIIRGLTSVDSFREITEIAAGETAEFLNASVMVAAADRGATLRHRHVSGEYGFDSIDDDVACLDALRSGTTDGAEGGRFHSSPKAHFLPICGKDAVLGAMGVSFEEGQTVTDNIRTFLETVCAQVAFALERERLRLTQEEVRLDVEKERLRSNLLRGISHDLRTPLTGILGSAETLRDYFATLDPGTRTGFIQEIIDESEWLRQMVENTLYLTKVEEEGVRLVKEPHPIEEIVAAAVERCGKRAGGVDLLVEMPGDFILVPADATLVVQALINLLDNAIRHSPEGGKVMLRVTPASREVIFEVTDQGDGIPPEDVGRVFDRFFSGGKDEPFPGRQKGIGLGLTVCKSIVEAHGGTISATNIATGGACFRFTLPREQE